MEYEVSVCVTRRKQNWSEVKELLNQLAALNENETLESVDLKVKPLINPLNF